MPSAGSSWRESSGPSIRPMCAGLQQAGCAVPGRGDRLGPSRKADSGGGPRAGHKNVVRVCDPLFMDREPREDISVRGPVEPAVEETYEAARVAFELGRAIRYRGRHRRRRQPRLAARG